MDYDGNTWRDRCNRYFSSLSDTEKDRDQEKHDTHEIHEHNNDERDRKRSDSSREEKIDQEWKDLGEIRNKVPGRGKFCRYVRRVFSILDTHGARLVGKSKKSIETVIWILITILAIVGTFVLIYFTVREYRLSSGEFTITDVSNLGHSSQELEEAAITICNLNILRKDKISATRFSYLLKLEDGIPNTRYSGAMSSIRELVTSNTQLVESITNDANVDVESVVDTLKEDIEVREMLSSSSGSVDDSLGRIGLWDIVRQRIKPTPLELETMGHLTEDMIVSCRVGQRNCTRSEIRSNADTTHGNCFTIRPEQTTERVELVLNAQPELYLHSVSPSVGFWIALRHFRSSIDAGPPIYAEPNSMTQIQLDKMIITKRRQPCTDEDISNECITSCYEENLHAICGCREKSNKTENMCNPDQYKEYICMKAVKILQKKSVLLCTCDQTCRDVSFHNTASSISWPSQQNINRVQDYLAQRGITLNETQIKSNILKVVIDMKPATLETREHVTKNIFELLATLGGLSAIVAGISVITILEIIWIMFKVAIDFIHYLCKRSQDSGSLQRLTDSEITSITWAMYRQKRRMEEINKEKEKNNRKTPNTIEGNVPSRLHRRSSYGSKVYDDQFEFRNVYPLEENTDRNYERPKPAQPNNDRNGYRRYCQLKAISEEKQDDGNEKPRRASEPPTKSDHSYSGYGYPNGFMGSSEYGYRDRPRGRVPSVPYIKPTQPPEGVRLYGGSAAYFYNNSAPTYL